MSKYSQCDMLKRCKVCRGVLVMWLHGGNTVQMQDKQIYVEHKKYNRLSSEAREVHKSFFGEKIVQK